MQYIKILAATKMSPESPVCNVKMGSQTKNCWLSVLSFWKCSPNVTNNLAYLYVVSQYLYSTLGLQISHTRVIMYEIKQLFCQIYIYMWYTVL